MTAGIERPVRRPPTSADRADRTDDDLRFEPVGRGPIR
jgi:hypothetical protein